ncbi:SGNH/GDSL hydrolase family protein [Rhodopirellula sp. MGV]|uniref:SGNH/GDSL hydrolase family protein n=1 Tax=Rhodopirellula sp. MGV TaxID=2023130 RepID=UPI000B96972B|nr:SGNH/GDSL hydrolase family protein [Rhodopirellula sp. MGV]OYP36374.1 hypothetical protein CGZ80_08665 [Rhodopirellula sp. MGV]PNY38394.1 SGNH/GDSL hydrolase family protein [Rhodopirellula baltica]
MNSISNPPTPSRQRRRLFRLISVLLALTPFAIAETYLQVMSDRPSDDLTWDPIFDTSAQPRLFRLDSASAKYRVDEQRLNFFRPASFEAVKTPQTKRVFVLGGSTVQGRPYEIETSFSEWTKQRLQAADPTFSWEVVNCGGVSYASYRVAVILDEVLGYQPDAIAIYCGHNEFLEERSYGTLSSNQGTLQAIASHSQLIQSIRRQLGKATVQLQPLPAETQTRLDLVEGMRRYVRDPEWRRSVEQHYIETMRRMIVACRNADVPLVVCVPTSEIVNTPPFKIVELDKETHDPDRVAAFQSQWAIAQDRERSDADRLQACQLCLATDPDHAGAHYLAGRIHWQHNRSELARKHLMAARDVDVCPLRATTPMIQSLQKLSDELNVVMVNCPIRFDQTDSSRRPLPDGIPDPDRFVDHVHPTIAGHQQIGADVASQLIRLLNITNRDDAESVYQSQAKQHLESLDETYFNRAKQRLRGLQNWAAGRAGKLSL